MVLRNFFKKDDIVSEKKELMKKIQNNRFIAAQAVEDNQALVRSLGIKIDDLKPKLPGLVDAQVQAERLKKDALLAFAIGQISQTEVDTARAMTESARKTQEESLELLEALEKAKAQAERAFPALQAEKSRTDQVFWRFVLEDLKSQINEVAKDLLISCHAASTRAYPGTVPHPGSFFDITNSNGASFALHTAQGMAVLDIEARGKVKELEEVYNL